MLHYDSSLFSSMFLFGVIIKFPSLCWSKGLSVLLSFTGHQKIILFDSKPPKEREIIKRDLENLKKFLL